MKEVSHGFFKKYKILQKLVYVMITVNISSNLRRVIRSTVTNDLIPYAIWLFINLGWVFRDILLMSVLKGKKYWDIRV